MLFLTTTLHPPNPSTRMPSKHNLLQTYAPCIISRLLCPLAAILGSNDEARMIASFCQRNGQVLFGGCNHLGGSLLPPDPRRGQSGHGTRRGYHLAETLRGEKEEDVRSAPLRLRGGVQRAGLGRSRLRLRREEGPVSLHRRSLRFPSRARSALPRWCRRLRPARP